VVREADVVTVVSPQMKRDFLPLGPKRIEVVPNGYDESDFEIDPIIFEGKFTLCHTGLFTRDANPDQLWRALAELVSENDGFAQALQIVLVGQTDGAVSQSIEEAGLLPYARFIPYVSHLEAVAYQKGADLLLLSLKKEPESIGIITGKFFEYVAAKKPILGIGPVEGDLAQMLAECNAGTMHEFEDYDGIKRSVLHYYRLFSWKKPWEASLPQAIAAYSRKNLCERMAGLLG
jgi:glycosyltransferase involved in cell wall biosynthesis